MFAYATYSEKIALRHYFASAILAMIVVPLVVVVVVVVLIPGHLFIPFILFSIHVGLTKLFYSRRPKCHLSLPSVQLTPCSPSLNIIRQKFFTILFSIGYNNYSIPIGSVTALWVSPKILGF